MLEKNVLKNIVVLYVEDEEELRTLTVKLLEQFVKKVFVAADGLEGVEVFKEDNLNGKTIDLIIADINMPKMDGLSMLQEILKIDSTVPSIITTAHSDADFLKRAINCKVRGYVTKPLNVSLLIDSIVAAVESRMLRKELENINHQLADQVEKKTKELRTILDFQENMVVVLDEHKISLVNKRFLEFFNLSSMDELVNERCISNYFLKEEDCFTPQNSKEWLQEILKRDDSKRIVKMCSATGAKKIFRLDIRSFVHNTKHYIVSFADITQLQEDRYKLQHKANHDQLTQLYNRHKFNEELEKEILREDRYQHNLSMIMFDIDDFKMINDTYGHDIGDIVLMKIAKVMKKIVRTTDIIARWGGEEFIVLLPETTLQETKQIAENIRKNIESLVFEEFERKVTISLGVSEYKTQKDTKESLLKHVDIALYKAKRSGKNQVVVYEEK